MLLWCVYWIGLLILNVRCSIDEVGFVSLKASWGISLNYDPNEFATEERVMI